MRRLPKGKLLALFTASASLDDLAKMFNVFPADTEKALRSKLRRIRRGGA